MATISGDQKQKLFVLAAFLGVLMLVGFFAMRTHSAPDDSTAAAPVAANTPAKPGGATPVVAKPAATKEPVKIAKAPDKKPAKPVTAKAPVIPQAKVAPLEPSRPDPFEPFYYPTPEPTSTPTPMPPPVQLPAPPTVSLPSPQLASAPPNTVLIGLPRPRVAGYAPLPGPIWARSGTPKTPEGGIQIRSANKRLSGVIIGDSVRALLEITTGDTAAGAGAGAEGGAGAAGAQTVVRVVQPGDEVDGIRILRIERVYEGGRQITRMFIREGNEERFVDLRPSPTPPAAAGTGGTQSEGGPPGVPGAPFGAIRPVGPGSFQRNPRNPNPIP